ncbi:hypothetical protein BV95_03105 [Sphingobium chlorophenolicum]|uniref:Uncharacterized protein n=1 Tax=Sphingobium chlorophenolicum TaxID=46429 RepID=A0A081RBT7_SPHCR|nr:hypothetical protein BV95_03105 [Sphingobium chlorophenolicum]
MAIARAAFPIFSPVFSPIFPIVPFMPSPHRMRENGAGFTRNRDRIGSIGKHS